MDILVTDAFGHSEWLERLVGHETWEVLAAADVPLLLVHLQAKHIGQLDAFIISRKDATDKDT